MRAIVPAIVAFGIGLSAPAPLWAGLYLMEPAFEFTGKDEDGKPLTRRLEPIDGPRVDPSGAVSPISFEELRLQLADLLAVLAAADSGFGQPTAVPLRRQGYLTRAAQLKGKEFTGPLSEEDRVNLSYYLIRLGQYEQAVGVLTPAAGRDCANFMLLCNLALANHLASPSDPSRLGRAVDYVQQALDLPEAEWQRLSGKQAKWYREVEKHYQTLIRRRHVELFEQAKILARGEKPTVPVDALFGPRDNPVRFIGESGQFEAGKIAKAEGDKLPPDALAIVQQLTLSMPADTRLLWLLGELYNARGDLASADAVLDHCIWGRNFNVPDLQEHWRIVKAARNAKPALFSSGQVIAVGAVIGLIVFVLAVLQFRELRRRWSGAPASKGC